MINNIHSSWNEFMTEERIQCLHSIEEQIGEEYTPKKENILRCLQHDLNAIKVVWVGQDPYFQPGVANGRSFQPNDLEDWKQTFKQVSLKNIIRLVHASYCEAETYDEIKKYKEVIADRDAGNFPILDPKDWFDSLEKQGVLFLNTSLTCKVNEPNSHKAIWSQFSKELIHYISMKRPDMIWFLWGKEAISLKENMAGGVFYESRHPMMCSSKYEDDFLKSRCFRETFKLINWLG